MMKYSPATRGFYSTDINTDMPPDAMLISDEVYIALIEAQGAGKAIVPGDNGFPIAVDRVHEPRVPQTITKRQFILALLAGGFIEPGDALAWAKATAVPPAFDPVLADMPDADALVARITLLTMDVAERASPLIGMVIAAGLATADQVDDVFRAGALI